ncbi:alpha/beta fold hydrolase [Roseovarius sp. CAU 1744]|uniref:alpha/beta fold hydrolase n=1 Tax=Roseovarius sp. CAU 1744 TaxID=3140368 RepID=UPI00325BBEB9
MASALLIDGSAQRKPWLVMVHGTSHDHRVFEAQIETFQSEFRLLLIDLPGHGLSSTLSGPYGPVEYAEHVAGTLASHGVEQAHFWGSHTGAGVGLALAVEHPSLFRSLVLEAPVIPGRNPDVVLRTLSKVCELAKSGSPHAALEFWWQESCWFDYIRAHPQRTRAEALKKIVFEFSAVPWTDTSLPAQPIDVSESLAQLTIPTLVYNGAFDHAGFLETAHELDECLPRCRRALVEKSGGFPAWENPSATNALVKGYYKSIGEFV